MDKKNFFITAFGAVSGIKDDLLIIASDQPKYIDSKNVFMASFKSMLSIGEMKEIIAKVEGRVYFLSEINDETFGYYIPNKIHDDHLFGKVVEEVEDIEYDSVGKDVVGTMSILELIDKGYENLSDEEKEFLKNNT